MESLLYHLKVLNEKLQLMQHREHGPSLSDRVILTKITNEVSEITKHLNDLHSWML